MQRNQSIKLIRSSGLFDDLFYLRQNNEPIDTELTLIEHYLLYGAARGLDPSPLFDTSFYVDNNPDVFESGLNPLIHYLAVGAANGRLPKGSRESVELQEILPQPKLIAFYLPQYHPIPENDKWWGRGFTEWTNVTRARPAFSDHYQPRLPSELGFYDLRVPEIRDQQVSLARQYGIHGFCYYYYWFNGRRILDRPLNDMLKSSKSDFPFCICWANENWTRRWDGLEQEVLLRQVHSFTEDNRFILDVIPILKDPRYIRVDDKPMLLVYRPELLEQPAKTADVWRRACREAGLPGLHLCAVEFKVNDPRPLGFDALVEFPPHYFTQYNITDTVEGLDSDFAGKVFDYYAGVAKTIERESPDFGFYRCAMPSWDNSARRRKHAMIFHGSTPEIYRKWLRHLILQASQNAKSNQSFVFINAWNEWAEGAVLEPSQSYGRTFLEATLAAQDASLSTSFINDAAQKSYSVLTSVARKSASSSRADDLKLTAVTSSPKISWVMTAPGNPARYDTSTQKILLVSHDAVCAGAELVLLENLKHFVKFGNLDCYVLLCHGGELEQEFQRHAKTFNLDNLVSTSLPRRKAIDIVIKDLKNHSLSMAICNTVLTGEIAKALHNVGIPVLSFIHELPTSIEMYKGRHAISQIADYSKRVIVVSDYVRDKLAASYGLNLNQFITLYPGIRQQMRAENNPGWNRQRAREEIFKELDLPSDAFLILSCGSVHPRKGTDLFVRVAKKLFLHPGMENVRFVWIGADQEGPNFRLWCEHDITVSGLGGKVVLAGRRSNSFPYFAAADAFALTSREDPFPQVCLEAMTHRLPVVAFDNAGGAKEALEPDAGIIVPYLDIESMAEKLSQLVLDRDLHYRIGNNGGAKSNTEYQWSRYIEDIVSIMRSDFGLCIS